MPLQRRTAFTLVEMVVAVTVSIAMVTAIGSSVLLVTQAVPDGKSVLDATAEGAWIAESISGELACALAFTAKTNQMVEFTVPDRNANGIVETIRYEWSGDPGDPLKRKYNNNTAVDVLENVYAFDLTYDIPSTSKTDTEVTSTDGSEQLLASFIGWDGILATTKDNLLATNQWHSEYFTVSPPAGITSLTFTKARLLLRRGMAVPTQDGSVAIHYNKNVGNHVPASSPIGDPEAISSAELSTTSTWYTFYFKNAVALDPTGGEFCLVIKGSDRPIYVEGLYSLLGPLNAVVQKWTDDSGATWQPNISLLNLQDLRFEVYGHFTTTDVHNNAATTSLLKNVNIRLQVGSNASSSVEAQVGILNTPQVSGS